MQPQQTEQMLLEEDEKAGHEDSEEVDTREIAQGAKALCAKAREVARGSSKRKR